MDIFNQPIEYPKPPSLRDLAVRVYIKTTGPGGDHKEKQITDEVVDANGVKRKEILEVRSKKFSRDHAKPWTSAAQNLKAWFGQEYPPYGNDGGRLVANAQLDEFRAEVQRRMLELDRLREKFMDELEEEGKKWAVDAGQVASKTKRKWPTRDDMHSKLRVEVDFQQITGSDDIRLGGLSGDHRKRYEDEIRACNEERMKVVTRHVADKVRGSVGNVLKRMGPPEQGGYVPNPGYKGGQEKNGFHNSLIENCKDIAGLLEHWNFTNDPEVDAVRKQMLTDIATLDPKELKKDPELRKQAHQSAKDILERVGRFGQHNN